MAADDAAVVVTLRANLKDYEAALKSAVRSTERAAAAAEKAISGVGKGGGASNVIAANFQKGASQIANDAKVLQFQLNDIFSGIASGQGIRAVQQQLGQIAQQLSGGGLAMGVRTMGAALVGMVNPINLAVVAFGVLASVAASYFSDTEKDAEAARKELDKQADAVENLAKKYGALFPELERIAKLRREEADAAEKAQAKEEALSGAYAKTQKTIDTTAGSIEQIQALLLDLGTAPDSVNALGKSWTDLEKATKEHKATSQEVKPVLAVLDTIIATQTGLVVELATAIRTQLVAAMGELDRAASSAADTLQKALDFQMPGAGGPLDLTPLQRARVRAASQTPESSRELLRSRSASKEIADSIDDLTDDMAQALAKLFAILPETARITSAVRSRAKQAALYADYRAGRGGLAAPPGRSRHEYGRAVDIGQGVSMEELQAAVRQVPELEQLKGRLYQMDKVHVQLKGTQKALDEEAADAAVKAAEEQAEAAAKSAKAMADYLASLDEQATLQERINEINRSGLSADEKSRAIEVETELQKALNLAKDNNITLSEKEIELIRQKAIANANADIDAESIKAAAKAEADALKQLEQAGLDVQKAMQGAMSSFITDLVHGKDASDALRESLAQLGEQMLQIALNNMFSMGGTGAKGGLLGGMLIPGILHKGGVAGADGYGSGRIVPASTFRGARRYHSGGLVGGEVPAILQKGEIVLPRGSALRPGGGNSTHRIVMQDDSGRMAEIADARIRTASGDIIEIATQTSMKAVKTNFTKMSIDSERRQR